MPLYEYRCRKCGAEYEKIRKFSDPVLTRCEKCGGELEQLLSSPAIRFKGSGFYITDYAKKSSDGGEKKSSDGGERKTEKPAATDSKSEPKKPSEPAPATKSDKK